MIVTHNGKTVLDAPVEPGRIARSVPRLRVKGAKAGDKITVTWIDNKGDKRTDEATVLAAS